MKRPILIFSGIFIAAFVIFLSLKPAIILLAKKQLNRVFVNSSVSIQRCDLKPLSSLSLSGIEIKRGEIYDIKIKEAVIKYHPLSIIKGSIDRFTLNDAEVNLNIGGKSILEFNKLVKFNTGKSPFSISCVELANLGLQVKSKELNLDSRVSTEINLAKQLVNSLDLKITFLEGAGLTARNVLLTAGHLLPSGIFKAELIKYDKLKIEKIEGNAIFARLAVKTLCLDSLSAELFGGKVKGGVTLYFGTTPLDYSASLNFMDIELNRFVQDFKLEEKVDLTGKMNGKITLTGSGASFTILDGGFTTNAPGGDLTIKDKSYLEKIAQNSGQSLDILVESFKNYRYNTGVMRLALEGGNLICTVDLDGQVGKRNLAITVHDFKLGR